MKTPIVAASAVIVGLCMVVMLLPPSLPHGALRTQPTGYSGFNERKADTVCHGGRVTREPDGSITHTFSSSGGMICHNTKDAIVIGRGGGGSWLGISGP